jgi:hypothetical protein
LSSAIVPFSVLVSGSDAAWSTRSSDLATSTAVPTSAETWSNSQENHLRKGTLKEAALPAAD